MKNGQPEPSKLYENLAKVVKSHEQLGLTKNESLEIIGAWKKDKQAIEKYELDRFCKKELTTEEEF